MYRENSNRKVTIAAHSMGSPIMLHFLTQSGVVTQEWKDRFIGNFIPIAGAWSGGNSALQFEVSGLSAINRRPGDMLNFFFRLQDSITDPFTPILRSFQSIHFLLPRPSVWGDTVLVTTPARSYTASDYQQLFSDIGLTDGFAMYQGIENINRDFPSPNVPTHCFYGVGIDTPRSFRYTRSFPEGANDDPQVTMGDGDGAVNLLSSEVCLRWAGNRNGGRPFKSRTFDGAEHMAILNEEAVLREIGSIVGAPANPTGWQSFSFFGR
jgi:lysophospholipase-3